MKNEVHDISDITSQDNAVDFDTEECEEPPDDSDDKYELRPRRLISPNQRNLDLTGGCLVSDRYGVSERAYVAIVSAAFESLAVIQVM